MKNDPRQAYLTKLSEGVLEPLKPSIEARDRTREALAHLEKALVDEEARAAKLGEEVTSLDQEILNLLGTGSPTASESSRLRKAKQDLEESQPRVAGLKAGIEARKQEKYHLEHDLLMALQVQVQKIRATEQEAIDREIGALVEKMEGFFDAVTDLSQALGFLNILGTGARYRDRAGNLVSALYSDEKPFLLDPRDALDAYLLKLGCCWKNLG